MASSGETMQMTTPESRGSSNEAYEQALPDGARQTALTPGEMLGGERTGDCSCVPSSSCGCSSDCSCGCKG